MRTQYPALSIDFVDSFDTEAENRKLPSALADPNAAPTSSLVLAVGIKKYVPFDIDAARSYSLLLGGLLEYVALPQTVAEREILLEIDHPVSTQGVVAAVLFLEAFVTLREHESALDSESRDLPAYLPERHCDFANSYIFPLGASKALNLLCEMLELGTYFNAPALKRFARSAILLLLSKDDLDQKQILSGKCSCTQKTAKRWRVTLRDVLVVRTTIAVAVDTSLRRKYSSESTLRISEDVVALWFSQHYFAALFLDSYSTAEDDMDHVAQYAAVATSIAP